MKIMWKLIWQGYWHKNETSFMVLDLFLVWERIDMDSMTNYMDHISGNNQIVNSPIVPI